MFSTQSGYHKFPPGGVGGGVGGGVAGTGPGGGGGGGEPPGGGTGPKQLQVTRSIKSHPMLPLSNSVPTGQA